MSPELGVEPDQLRSITATWRREAGDVAGTVWSALSGAGGDGSDVLAAVRDTADPAQQAMRSIADRYGSMAGLVDKFLTNIVAKDAEIADEFGKLSPR